MPITATSNISSQTGNFTKQLADLQVILLQILFFNSFFNSFLKSPKSHGLPSRTKKNSILRCCSSLNANAYHSVSQGYECVNCKTVHEPLHGWYPHFQENCRFCESQCCVCCAADVEDVWVKISPIVMVVWTYEERYGALVPIESCKKEAVCSFLIENVNHLPSQLREYYNPCAGRVCDIYQSIDSQP